MSDNYDDSTNIEDDALFDEELLEDYDFTDDLELSTNKNTIHDTIGNVTNIPDGPKAIPTGGKLNKKLKYSKEANKKEELPTKINKGKNPLENKPEVQKGRMNPVSVQRNKTSATESTSGNKQKNKASGAAKFYEDIFDDNQIKKAELDNSLAYSDVIKTQKEVTKPTQTTTPQPISENKTTANKVNKPQVSTSVPNKNVQNETMKQTKKTTNEPQTPKAGVPKSNVLKQTKKKKAMDAAYGRMRSNASRGLPSGVPRAFLMKQSNMNSIEPRAPHTDNEPTPQGSLIPLVDNTAVKAKQLENMMKKLNKKFNPPNPVTQTYVPIEQHNVPNAPFYPMMDQYQPMTPQAQPYAQPNYGQNPNPQVYQSAPPMYGQAYDQSYTMPVAPVPPQNIPNPVLFQTPLDQHSLAQHAPLHVETATAGQSDPSPNYQSQERQLMYSPSDVYSDSKQDTSGEQEKRAGSETHEFTSQAGQKRLSAFQRLGPLTESKVTKKPKLTINLLLKKEEDVREVLDGENNAQEHIPVYRRPDIINSENAVVQKFLPFWPWKKNIPPKKTSSARVSKSAMIVELEQMEEIYLKDNMYFQITVKGYPETWTKERVMDTILNAVKGKSFIPCFIEFTKEQCIFLVIKSYSALVALHKMFFVIPSKEVELKLSIGYLALNTNHLSFLPKLVLESIILSGYDSESKLSLKAFTMDEDVSHFIYYPLSRLANQVELIQSQRGITWTYITDLDLSGNRLTTLDGFDLSHNCPKLKHLNLSNNYFTRISNLLGIRSLPLRSITLEGNPLCHDYIDPDHYVMVLRTAFNTLREIDGIPVRMKGELPPCIRNYCPQESIDFVEQFLSVYFPLMDSPPEDKHLMENLYHENAVLTITYRENLRSQAVFRRFRNLLLRARVLSNGDVESVRGAAAVARHLARAPPARHDLAAHVDVMYHGEDAVVLKLTGIMKLTAETLAEDEHLIAYSRTFVFKTTDGVEYKIVNEMLYWDEPTPEYANNAFKFTMIKSKPISLKIEGTPDEDLKEKLVELFMKVTNLKEGPSYRCLEMKDWNFKLALQLFFKLLKLDNLSSLLSEKDPSP